MVLVGTEKSGKKLAFSINKQIIALPFRQHLLLFSLPYWREILTTVENIIRIFAQTCNMSIIMNKLVTEMKSTCRKPCLIQGTRLRGAMTPVKNEILTTTHLHRITCAEITKLLTCGWWTLSRT